MKICFVAPPWKLNVNTNWWDLPRWFCRDKLDATATWSSLAISTSAPCSHRYHTLELEASCGVQQLAKPAAEGHMSFRGMIPQPPNSMAMRQWSEMSFRNVSDMKHNAIEIALNISNIGIFPRTSNMICAFLEFRHFGETCKKWSAKHQNQAGFTPIETSKGGDTFSRSSVTVANKLCQGVFMSLWKVGI